MGIIVGGFIGWLILEFAQYCFVGILIGRLILNPAQFFTVGIFSNLTFILNARGTLSLSRSPARGSAPNVMSLCTHSAHIQWAVRR
ncbi:hypothetical protein R84865_001381 [Carnimonas sp. R-84865]